MLSNGSLYFPPFPGELYSSDVHTAAYRCAASNPAGTILSREMRVRAGESRQLKKQPTPLIAALILHLYLWSNSVSHFYIRTESRLIAPDGGGIGRPVDQPSCRAAYPPGAPLIVSAPRPPLDLRLSAPISSNVVPLRYATPCFSRAGEPETEDVSPCLGPPPSPGWACLAKRRPDQRPVATTNRIAVLLGTQMGSL